LGQSELARLRPLVDQVQQSLTEPLTAQEHQQLRSLLAKLVDSDS
jgi:DNA-binding MarR family transcriptional regulator